MANDMDVRRKARSDYVYRRMTQATIAMTLGISQATFGRWKKASKENGDDWDIARSASLMAGEGIETVVSSVVEDFMIMAQSLLDEIKNGELGLDQKVKHLVALADAMTKMTASAGKLAPKISELGVAQDVMQYLVEFVRENFPQHIAAILEIIEPFGEQLARRYGS
ncbi:alkylhydroperoxidase/carboxymuconolactone decarboxylase family protein YurZ [Rhizobium aquaticum]|uniref:Alkylhydroperoxidase/carboxymuconolactone decarboxylase family protein YurZ n=1 Tax=Rhizobium aquaticum TaxID=1549636 RepID=A0ABV2IVN1_9HYPH